MPNSRFIILAGLRTFLITSTDGAPDNQYRIHDRCVEFRSVAPGGPPNPDLPWRVLQADEVQLHFALRTPVADWLNKTLYRRGAASPEA